MQKYINFYKESYRWCICSCCICWIMSRKGGMAFFVFYLRDIVEATHVYFRQMERCNRLTTQMQYNN